MNNFGQEQVDCCREILNIEAAGSCDDDSPGRRRYRAEPYRLIRLALGTTAISHPEVLALFKCAGTDANPAVRRAAINALGLTQWVEAFDPLEDRTANDPTLDLREFAQRTLYSLRRALGMEQ